MRGKIFSPEEAERMLPLVARVVEDIQTTYREVHGALEAFDTVKRALESSTGAASIANEREFRARDAEVARLLDVFQGLVEEIEALGGMVKDYEKGTVDFYGELDGEIVFLSWAPGEDRVAHWHPLDAGQTERRPLAETITL